MAIPLDVHGPLRRHERIVLQFSGGRDSLATLLACHEYWNKIVVVWGNRGADFPETLETIEKIKQWPINFVEVHAPLPHEMSMAIHGYPVDMVPLGNTANVAAETGREMTGPLLQPYLACCNRMLFEPLDRFCTEYEATLIIRGQRLEEAMVSPVRSGDVIDGVEYFFPLESMTLPEVDQFIIMHGVEVPAHYQHTGKSLDCWSCTAYLHESVDQLAYTKEFHPKLWQRLAPRIREIRRAVSAELDHLDAAVALTEEKEDERQD